jgi:hypothetical protein
LNYLIKLAFETTAGQIVAEGYYMKALSIGFTNSDKNEN